MQFKRTLVTMLGLASAALAQAQGTWPTRPITLVVPFAAGGPTDVVARTLGAAMTKSLGQTVVVENKLGAGGTVAASYVAKTAPDGYTFFIHHNGMATSTALYRKLSYDPLKDFEFVSQAVEVPMKRCRARTSRPPTSRSGDLHRANKDKINLPTPAGRRLATVRDWFQRDRRAGDEVPFRARRWPCACWAGRSTCRAPDHQTVPADQGRQRELYGVTTKNLRGRCR
jgi:hypothetical protein